MTGPATTDGIDPGLRARFRAASEKISWRDAASAKAKGRRATRAKRSVRIAHLNDEEARIEERTVGTSTTLVVESGPVGALVLLMRWEENGPPARLTTHESGTVEGFGQGAIEACWEPSSAAPSLGVPLSDLVGLARYALA